MRARRTGALAAPLRRPSRPLAAALLVLGAASASLAARPARAQGAGANDAGAADSAGAGEARRVAGRVVRPGADGPVAAPGTWVTIHRVGPDRAGPIDSARTDASGRYAFRYRTSGSDRAIYFVSASYGGIAYFSSPLAEPDVSGDAAEITVFDTTSAPVPVSVRGRHVVVLGAGRGARREVVEVYDLSNDTTVTRVARDSGSAPTWTAVVPEGARDFKAGQGDAAPDAVRLDGARVEVFAPLAPGLKQLSFSYTLPAASFPLRVPVDRATQVLEVLVEGPAGAASGAGLREVSPVAQGGHNFRRFLAQDAPVGAVASVAFPAAAMAGSRSLYVALAATLAGAALLLVLARAAGRMRRPALGMAGSFAAPLGRDVAVPGAAAAAAPAAADPERLAREIAALDASFERQRAPSDEARSAYQARRDALKRELTAALAARERRA